MLVANVLNVNVEVPRVVKGNFDEEWGCGSRWAANTGSPPEPFPQFDKYKLLQHKYHLSFLLDFAANNISNELINK